MATLYNRDIIATILKEPAAMNDMRLGLVPKLSNVAAMVPMYIENSS